jgi:exportin-2 (importin alpha re-exporter)
MIYRCQPDDTTPSLSSQIKTRIFEIAEVGTQRTFRTGYSLLGQLYTKLYPEVLQSSGSVELFVTATWELLSGGKLPGVSDDHVR